MRTRPNHIDFDNPRGTNIADFPFTLDRPREISPTQREHVCDVIESFGYWGTEIPDMLGLVER